MNNSYYEIKESHLQNLVRYFRLSKVVCSIIDYKNGCLIINIINTLYTLEYPFEFREEIKEFYINIIFNRQTEIIDYVLKKEKDDCREQAVLDNLLNNHVVIDCANICRHGEKDVISWRYNNLITTIMFFKNIGSKLIIVIKKKVYKLYFEFNQDIKQKFKNNDINFIVVDDIDSDDKVIINISLHYYPNSFIFSNDKYRNWAYDFGDDLLSVLSKKLIKFNIIDDNLSIY